MANYKKIFPHIQTGHIVPYGTDTYNVGDPSLQFDNIYANNIHAGSNLYVDGSLISPDGGGITWSTPVDATIMPNTGTSPLYDLGSSSNPFRSMYLGVNDMKISMVNNTSAIYLNSDGTFVGMGAAQTIINSNLASDDNTFVGHYAGFTTDTSAPGGTIIGDKFYTTGGLNTFVGSGVGKLNHEGRGNTIVGALAAQNASENSWNVIMGAYTLEGILSFEEGFDNYLRLTNNIALGNQILHDASGVVSNNILIGHAILNDSDTSYSNLMIGNDIYSNTTNATEGNTIIGMSAGYNGGGEYNTFLGNRAGYHETGSNKLIIANDDSSGLIFGDFSTGRVDIKTSLYVNGIAVDASASSTSINISNYDSSTTLMRVLGSNTATSTSNVYSTSGIYMNYGTDYIYATNFQLTSDLRLKENIQLVEPRNIDDVKIVSFNMIGNPVLRHGVIAQDLEESHPELVSVDEQGIKSVAYQDYNMLKFAKKDEQIIKLEALVNKLEERIYQLENK